MTTNLNLVFLFLLSTTAWPCVKSGYYEDSSEEVQGGKNQRGNNTGNGISPPVLNLATKADIFSNATCGEREPETYCKLVEHVHFARARTSQCSVCNSQMGNGKRHPIRFAIDGSNRWWQSPTLASSLKYEYVTITIDLKQVYQVAYVIVKAGISPRPGNWILERSLDGILYQPWQFYAISDEECWTRYGIRAKPGKPSYDDDEEIICTSYYSSLQPFEGGEIHTSIINGRPGAEGPSEKLTKFTMARYVRLRLQKIRTLHGDLMNVGGPERSLDKSVMRRYFYSIKDISIGGHCVCFGTEKCMCQHNTMGDTCDMCKPLFNQYQWSAGNSTANAVCKPCQCHGQSDVCVFDPVVASQKLSIDTEGAMDGGGVCLDCKAHTTGINCEKCVEGFYRPKGVRRHDTRPCVKCQCDMRGSDGSCVVDVDMADILGKEPGDCICKAGFGGKHCDHCILGYRGFPACNPCPCHLSGIVNTECEGNCVCKENVQGQLCAECKKGFYNLIKENPEGCTQCFCHAVTDKCTSSNFAITRMIDRDNWFVTDLHGTKVIALTPTNGMYHIANEEFSYFSMYYWGHAKTFIGVLSYGLEMIFHISWTRARGDTSGKPIQDYDLIIQSTNNMLAFSNKFHEGDNATIHVTLNEIDCFVLPDIDNNIIQRHPTPTMGTPCTRLDVMEGMHDVKRLLIRTKYHTDQIEGALSYAFLEKADINTIAGPGERAASSVELCTCPPGYKGTSCQDCAYGYRKNNPDSSFLNVCLKCDCNGHSPACDFNGKCLGCEHNTTGARCQYCRDGFYGDPSSESQFACKPCECPLAVESNNFSPTCEISGNSYECTACPEGHEGPFCEICKNGYFGNPTQLGDFCKPCECNLEATSSKDNVCDHLTGECLMCPKNTIGWNCDECVSGHFRNSLNGTCTPCRCDEEGSISTDCHPETGECSCKENFTGRRCTDCLSGFGNPEDGCPSCHCNPEGSLTLECNKMTGQCYCKIGVGGKFCNKCLEHYFGFSTSGCTLCDCHEQGSDSAVCDLNTGFCHCLPNVVGRKCDTCVAGYWNIKSASGCVPCDCNQMGSLNNNCDSNGQCFCKSGVTGRKCDQCKDDCFGFSVNGCRPCDPCLNHNHVCDQFSGRCGCPPNTEGANCSECSIGYWGYSRQGCKPCSCSPQGSTTMQCRSETGKCTCAPGFEGEKCEKCQHGYYNYPHCTPCLCDLNGSDPRFCNSDGICSCGANGQCQCKGNVAGLKCSKCSEGSYGLELNRPEGCVGCFCFHRTTKCSQGFFKWQRLALPSDRNIIPSAKSENQLRIVNGLIVIPDQANDVILEKDISFSAPLYWQMPHIYLGDKVLSYNGYLRFRTISIGGSAVFPARVLSSYPLVQIQRYPSLILEHFSESVDPLGFHEVRLHEDDWKLKNGPNSGIVSKETMMVVLQNLHSIFVRGTHGPEIVNATLYNVSLDIAVPTINSDKSVAHGIEVCDCPPQYNSTSCQNPRIGFYRWYKRDYITSTVIIDLIGEVKPCECNGRSSICDTETGFCQNCTNFTGGRNCEQCAIGYYGDPSQKCSPCPCPSIWNNHAESCYQPALSTEFKCFCRPSYTGDSCERCDYGYYGKPWEAGGSCTNCNCNEYGSVSDECHELTGQCNCRAGVSGRDCSKCADRHVIVGKVCTSCDDHCTGTLLNSIQNMKESVKDVHINKDAVSSIVQLMHWDNASKILEYKIRNKIITRAFIDDFSTHETLLSLMQGRLLELITQCKNLLMDANVSKSVGEHQLKKIMMINQEIRNVVAQLEKFIFETGNEIDTSAAETKIASVLKELEETSKIIEEMGDLVEDEMDAAEGALEMVYLKVYNSTAVGSINKQIQNIRARLDDLLDYISQADKNSDEAARIVILAKEFLDSGHANEETIQNLVIDMDISADETITLLSESRYAKTELEQVLMMLEDIVSDFRNSTKELEILENALFELIPQYRVIYAQPAFDHVKWLQEHAKYLEGLLIRINGSEPFEAVTAYQRIKDGYDAAAKIALEALETAADTADKIDEILSKYSLDILAKYSEELIHDSLALSGIVENSLRLKLSKCKSDIDTVLWRMKIGQENLKTIHANIEELGQHFSLDGLKERTDEILDTINESAMEAMEIQNKIDLEMLPRINSFGPINSVAVTAQIHNAQQRIGQAKSEVSAAENRNANIEGRKDSIEDRMKYLKALIKQARHKTNTVGVSVGPDETGTCFRLYKWPVMDSSTSIKFNFAPTKFSDSLLFYWPSSISNDFIAIEMVSGQIKSSWDLGSGLRTLVHPRKLSEVSENSSDPQFWVEIHLERIGSSVTLNVKPISLSDNSIFIVPLPSADGVTYINNEEESTLMNLAANDLIHIGGMSKLIREGLVSNGLSGCIHNLQVNRQSVGLWNFVGNEGCAPCMECPDVDPEPNSRDLEYYFDGRGYSVVDRVQSTTFNSRFFDVNIEFRTLSENGLMFLTVNDVIGQLISLEIVAGRIVMQVRHRWNDTSSSLHIESNETYNNGEWTKVRAVWVLQKGKQIGKLMVGTKDFSREKLAIPIYLLDLKNAAYQMGGVSPIFDPTKWKDPPTTVPFVGCMKSILINNSPYDPLSGTFYGVQSPCGGKAIYLTSFDGNGFAEFGSMSMGKNFKFGFSFKTLAPTGLLLLSASTDPNTLEDNYYAIYLENGEIIVQLGVNSSLVELLGNGTRYDDGNFHAVRFVKKSRKLILYIDDEEISDGRLPKNVLVVSAHINRGLFLGGASLEVQKKFTDSSLPVTRGFSGCIQNLYFNNDLLTFSYPVSHKNQNLGQCPKHHEYDPASIPTHFLYPNTIDTEFNRYDLIPRAWEESCSTHEHIIEQEDPIKALKFGDSPRSYVTLGLDGGKQLKQRFNLTLSFRSYYPDGLLFQGLKKKGNGQCLTVYLKNGQVVVHLQSENSQRLLSHSANFNDGAWHQLSLVKAEERMYLFMDNKEASQTQFPKIRAISKLIVGGIPPQGPTCWEYSMYKPEHFKGCMKNFILNSHAVNFETSYAKLNEVNPCFREVEPGTFFRAGSYAIYTYNFTLGGIVELELEFRSDSQNGLLFAYIPNKSTRHPTFSIFLESGKLVARESLSLDDYYETIAEFREGEAACNGKWHTLRAVYETNSITLRLDQQQPIFAVAEPSVTSVSSWNHVVGTVYIGGIQDDASHLIKKRQFHGCIRNVSVNGRRTDWTDMIHLSKVHLNSCPI